MLIHTHIHTQTIFTVYHINFSTGSIKTVLLNINCKNSLKYIEIMVSQFTFMSYIHYDKTCQAFPMTLKNNSIPFRH